VAGSKRSAVAVLKTIASISPAVMPARSIACRAAVAAIEHVLSPSDVMCRSRMPVRSTIHSSFVSRPSAAKS
jgi:hypothetical protein